MCGTLKPTAGRLGAGPLGLRLLQRATRGEVEMLSHLDEVDVQVVQLLRLITRVEPQDSVVDVLPDEVDVEHHDDDEIPQQSSSPAMQRWKHTENMEGRLIPEVSAF